MEGPTEPPLPPEVLTALLMLGRSSTATILDASSADALLSRPFFAKFMTIPNYTYLKLKMPSPKGVITVKGSFEQAYYFEQDCVTQVTALITPYAPDGPSHDIGRALMGEAAKTATVVLDQPSISKAVKTPGNNGGSASPSI